MLKNFPTKYLGWYGVLAILGAYALTNLSIIGVHDARYQWLNITGSIAIVLDALAQKDWPQFSLNLAWAVIGLIAVARVWL